MQKPSVAGKQTYKNRLQALEQAPLATSTACCCCTHKHARVYCYYGNAHQFLRKSGPVKTGPTWPAPMPMCMYVCVCVCVCVCVGDLGHDW